LINISSLKAGKSVSEEEFLALQDVLVAQDRWIIDGNSIHSLERRYRRADVVLCFLQPRLLCLWRIIKRRFRKDKRIDDRAPGCREPLKWKLFKNLWYFEDRALHKLENLHKQYPHTKLYFVKNDKAFTVLLRDGPSGLASLVEDDNEN
jgi:adenylate kinase family enzyme